LNEKPPRFGSKRFREILWPALAGDPIRALSGLYWFATRRRVRGWSSLLIAATNGPGSYRRWIRSGERHAFECFRAAHPRHGSASVVALMLSDPSSATDRSVTLASLRAALGQGVPIYSAPSAVAGAGSLPEGTPGDLPGILSSIADAEQSDWVLVALAGDRWSPALGETLGRSVVDNADAPFLYWDEDKLEDGPRSDPWIKPDWDELLFGRLGGLAGASLISAAALRSLLPSVTRVSADRDGLSQLCLELARHSSGAEPVHIPLVLTHRDEENALGDEISLDPLPSTGGEWPSVSILVPTRDRAYLLSAYLQGIERTSYPGPLELIVVDNGSIEPAAQQILERLEGRARTKVLRDPGPFNFPRLNNSAAAVADGEFLCFMNNDVEPLDDNWLTMMMSHARQEGVGAVGAMLLYPSGRIQHAGVAIGVGGAAGHVQKGIDPADRRFRTWHQATREVSALTAAAMIVRKNSFHEVGGLDEAAFPIAFNDVDLCLRLKQMGLRNIYVAEAKLLHHESESRPDDRSPEQFERFSAELKRLQERWQTEGFVDPHYSPLFSRLVEQCVLAP
jgi:GT2 family glycosyltransferase